MHYHKCGNFYDLEETRGIWRPEPGFCGIYRGSSLQPTNQETVPGKPGQVGSMSILIYGAVSCYGLLQVGRTQAVCYRGCVSLEHSILVLEESSEEKITQV
jgi:hypothetical protein